MLDPSGLDHHVPTGGRPDVIDVAHRGVHTAWCRHPIVEKFQTLPSERHVNRFTTASAVVVVNMLTKICAATLGLSARG
jgi:hypothetical protein